MAIAPVAEEFSTEYKETPVSLTHSPLQVRQKQYEKLLGSLDGNEGSSPRYGLEGGIQHDESSHRTLLPVTSKTSVRRAACKRLAVRGGLMVYSVLSMAGMLVLLRVWGMTAPSHSFFFSFSWAVGFVPFFGVMLLVKRLWYKLPPARLDGWKPTIRQSVLVSFLLALNYFGISTSNPHVEGPAQIIISQLPLVFTMIFTRLLLHRKYDLAGYVAAGIVLFAAVADVILPQMAGESSDVSSAPVGWLMMNIVGNIPLGILPVTFEVFHKVTHPVDRRPITVEWRLMITNVFVALWLLLFIPFYGALGEPPLSEFGTNIKNSLACVYTGRDSNPADDCSIASPVLFLLVPVAALQMHSQVR